MAAKGPTFRKHQVSSAGISQVSHLELWNKTTATYYIEMSDVVSDLNKIVYRKYP